MNDKLKEIAVYDGWDALGNGAYRRNGYTLNESELGYTRIQYLHPVAMKVLGELREIEEFESVDLETAVEFACSQPPINGEYIDLFNAVYDAIVYLKNAKK